MELKGGGGGGGGGVDQLLRMIGERLFHIGNSVEKRVSKKRIWTVSVDCANKLQWYESFEVAYIGMQWTYYRHYLMNKILI